MRLTRAQVEFLSGRLAAGRDLADSLSAYDRRDVEFTAEELRWRIRETRRLTAASLLECELLCEVVEGAQWYGRAAGLARPQSALAEASEACTARAAARKVNQVPGWHLEPAWW